MVRGFGSNDSIRQRHRNGEIRVVVVEGVASEGVGVASVGDTPWTQIPWRRRRGSFCDFWRRIVCDVFWLTAVVVVYGVPWLLLI